MKAVSKAAGILLSVVLWIVILTAALFAFTTLATRDDAHVANLAGFTPMSVQTDSMAPTFNAGDLIIIKTCNPETLKVGDIITFHTIIQNQYALNTHRISEINEVSGVRNYTTKGDNNLIADTHVIAGGDIVGRYVTRLPKMGLVMDFLSTSAGFLCVIVLPLLVFFVYQVYHLVMVAIELKKATIAEAAEAAAMVAPAEDTAAKAEAEKAQQDAQRAKEEAEKAMAEAQAALEEARRLKAEAEAMKNKE